MNIHPISKNVYVCPSLNTRMFSMLPVFKLLKQLLYLLRCNRFAFYKIQNIILVVCLKEVDSVQCFSELRFLKKRKEQLTIFQLLLIRFVNTAPMRLWTCAKCIEVSKDSCDSNRKIIVYVEKNSIIKNFRMLGVENWDTIVFQQFYNYKNLFEKSKIVVFNLI